MMIPNGPYPYDTNEEQDFRRHASGQQHPPPHINSGRGPFRRNPTTSRSSTTDHHPSTAYRRASPASSARAGGLSIKTAAGGGGPAGAVMIPTPAPLHSSANAAQRMLELRFINKSLFHLSEVIQGLRRAKKVCFRNSKLTFLLQDWLSSKQIFLLACASPSDLCFEESLSTFRFADCVSNLPHKRIVPGAMWNFCRKGCNMMGPPIPLAPKLGSVPDGTAGEITSWEDINGAGGGRTSNTKFARGHGGGAGGRGTNGCAVLRIVDEDCPRRRGRGNDVGGGQGSQNGGVVLGPREHWCGIRTVEPQGLNNLLLPS